MDILSQAIALPAMRDLKDYLLSNSRTRLQIEKHEPVSYRKELSVIVEEHMEVCFHQAVDFILTMWHLFPDELAPLYALVDIDAEWADGRMIRVVWEAKRWMESTHGSPKD